MLKNLTKKTVLALAFMFAGFCAMQAQNTTQNTSKLYHQIQQADSLNNYDDAIELYHQLLAISPKYDSGFGWLELAELYLKKDKNADVIDRAISCWKEYLRLYPNSPNRDEIQTNIDKHEYLLDKTNQRNALFGRWASVDGKEDEFGRSTYILDIRPVKGKVRVELIPSSKAYTPNYLSAVIYIDEPNQIEYPVFFRTEDIRKPSGAWANFISKTGQLLGGLVSNQNNGAFIGNSADFIGERMMEQPAKKITSARDIYLKTTLNKDGELESDIHEFEAVKTIDKDIDDIYSDKITFDKITSANFYKVADDYMNHSPLVESSFLGIRDIDGLAYSNKLLKNNLNEEISKRYKRGVTMRIAGGAAFLASIVPIGIGAHIWRINPPSYRLDDYPDEQRVLFGSKVMGVTLTSIGLAVAAAGITTYGVGMYNTQKAKCLYNQQYFADNWALRHRQRALREIRVGSTLAFSSILPITVGSVLVGLNYKDRTDYYETESYKKRNRICSYVLFGIGGGSLIAGIITNIHGKNLLARVPLRNSSSANTSSLQFGITPNGGAGVILNF